MLDLSTLKAASTLDHEVEHPTQGLTGWIVTLAGDGHPATKAAVRVLLDKRSKRKVHNAALDEADALALLVARTLSWKGLFSCGEEVVFSPHTAEEIYSTEGLEWVRRQVLAALGDDALFFKG
jgi:hypothetical protein